MSIQEGRLVSAPAAPVPGARAEARQDGPPQTGGKAMRIVLLYPPPWKIPPPGERADRSGDGPPADWNGQLGGPDTRRAPYGLLSIAAQALRAGHQVKTFNLSTFPWRQVDALLGGLEADLYGLTCFTSNRRGVALVARCIRQYHPDAHVVVGGPHASALPAEMLRHHPAIDTVVIGEGEETFLELVERLEAGRPTGGIAGTAWRGGDGVRIGPPRERIADIDSLASLHESFAFNTILTSRGCPGRCTFCASRTTWGSKVTFHSVEYVLRTIERILRWLPIRTIAFKDDTFTANRRRAAEICRGILDRKLNFLWSCDTRADALDEELLRLLRLAGCQQISLGVESASPEILRNIRKHVVPGQVLEATRAARKFGVRVRYFLIAGNRGETRQTFEQTVRFLRKAQPDQYLFSILSIFPGTAEYEILRREGRLSSEDFFRGDFQEYWLRPEPRIMRQLERHHLTPKIRLGGVAEYEGALRRLGDVAAAHLDLGAAYLRANQPKPAERHVRKALELGYPVPELAWNYLAALAGQRGDLPALEAHLRRATLGKYPHPMVSANLRSFRRWLAAGGPRSGGPLQMTVRHDFEHIMPTSQPVSPGPLPPDCCDWPAPAPQGRAASVA
jgi:anaerobic magnesium-protoporphyrin IX monomethyl ester cyclase